MNILLTGGTGFVGHAVLRQLVEAGHQVTGLVRSDTSADQVRSTGASALIGDLLDTDWVAAELAATDGAIHTASPGDATSADFDTSMARAAVRAFSGTTKPYVHTSGIWIYGSGAGMSEDSPLQPPALTAWRPGVEAIVLDSDILASVVVPSVVYGHGSGLPNLLVHAPRTADGALTLIGDGRQHWSTVHVEDLAALYLLVVGAGQGLGHVIGVNEDTPTVRELAEATGSAVAEESVGATRSRVGEAFADALLLDQQVSNRKAVSLGWTPTGPSLTDELRRGSYAGAGDQQA